MMALVEAPGRACEKPAKLPPKILSWMSELAHQQWQPFNGPLSGTTHMSQYQKSKTNLDFTEARDSERQWHQLVHMQVCTSLQTDKHANTTPVSFLQAGCPSCCPTYSVKALCKQKQVLKNTIICLIKQKPILSVNKNNC